MNFIVPRIIITTLTLTLVACQTGSGFVPVGKSKISLVKNNDGSAKVTVDSESYTI